MNHQEEHHNTCPIIEDSEKQRPVLEILKYISTILATIVISMVGFWLTIGKDYVSRTEAKEIATTELRVLTVKLDIYIEESKQIKQVIEKNNEAINGLKIQMSSLEQTLTKLMVDQKTKGN